jgi:transcriptional regulator with XRE-family HTH domain
MRKKKKYALARNFFEFGEYLKEKRIAAGLTQQEVADQVGYSSAQYISNFERGISLPPLSKLKVMVRLYRMPKAEVIQMITEAKAKILNMYL